MSDLTLLCTQVRVLQRQMAGVEAKLVENGRRAEG